MRDFFTGKKVELLTEEKETPGICVWHLDLEEKELGHMSCRLEDDVTFIRMVRGNMVCQINQEKVEMKSGEGIFINSCNAYRFISSEKGGCEFYVAAVDKEYLKADEATAEKFVNPVVKEDAGFWLKLMDAEEQAEVLDCIVRIAEAVKKKETGYELELRSLAFRMWMNLYRSFTAAAEAPTKAELKEKMKLYKMLEFLHINYTEKITLGELAKNSGISTGEYCRFFKKRMGQTPFEYLQAYRIERSLPEMVEKSLSTTKIVLKHGFSGSSYYAETFKKEMGCVPGDYRKWCRGEYEGECPLRKMWEQPQEAEKTAEQPTEKPAPVPVRRESMPAHLL